MQPIERTTANGLYSPVYEHDACGVGLICNLKGEKSHDLIHKALEILVNLTHRGATGSDPKTGDGAGILFQIPHQFFSARCAQLGIRIPDAGEYGAGLVFLPTDAAQRAACEQWFADAIRSQGQVLLGWRDVPRDNRPIGRTARDVEPCIRQIFIGRGKGVKDADQFERKLYVIRKIMERTMRDSDLPQKKFFHMPSLSCRTLVYKGLLLADQIEAYYPDLADPLLTSGLALVHQRYSTNTFPTWDLAQPFRFLCHNGEINTIRGNTHWLLARQGLFQSEFFGHDIQKLFPVPTPGASDSAILDNALELLLHTGRSLPHAMMMLIPEAWQNARTMPDEKKAFYEYHSCLMEPWDGPASIPFTDGKVVGAMLDRNGLRPSRYTVTKDGFVVMGSETGVLPIDPANVLYKGRLQPGRMFLVDTQQGRIVEDEEIKDSICRRKPYRTWLAENLLSLDAQPEPRDAEPAAALPLEVRQRLFGYTVEDFKYVINPTVKTGLEPTGSMGDDTPLAVLSNRPQLLFTYFRHLFAQVTNPPLDAIREECVTSLIMNLGAEQDLFSETPQHCRQVKIDSPILTAAQMLKLRALKADGVRTAALSTLFEAGKPGALAGAMARLCREASEAVDAGATILILSDRGADAAHVPIPSLLAVSGVHHHLIRGAKRTRCGIVMETGEAREVHHYALLFGYGAGAVHPYLALETLADQCRRGVVPADVAPEKALQKYIKASLKGVLKVMSKMGISTLHSYRGAQIFEAVGLASSLIDLYFTGTPSRVEGIDIDVLEEESMRRHQAAFPAADAAAAPVFDPGGVYQWRRNGERHLFNPSTIPLLQRSTRENNEALYREYAALVNDTGENLMSLRSLLDFKKAGSSIPVDEVEPVDAIVRRFKTGAMSYGSISQEAHETLAIAMNRLGGRSNTGEGGEDAERFQPDANGDLRRSSIKQVASGRFGVTMNYLVNADELQIKMAQGAKPGEGGQLPGEKVYPWIARTRHSTPYVQLISPPPHHDIYSIEDLAQLIFDLKNANNRARVSVKLVAEAGVGTVAAGVSKGKADVILISGHDGGTGASPRSSIVHAGLPWELGIAETHQTLVLNDLRDRVYLECDGKLMTGRDVAIACMLGAEEFGFSTAPLVVLGCIMMRVCHLNTCPVGITTQDPELRKFFTGRPEHLVNFFHFVAQELREIMASLGLRTINEMVGRSDLLQMRRNLTHWKARYVDLSRILEKPLVPETVGVYRQVAQVHPIDQPADLELLEKAAPAVERGERVRVAMSIRNVNRTFGTRLSSEITRRHGGAGLPEDTVSIDCRGSAGQSFLAFGCRGITMRVTGDANDYFCKGLSGAKVAIVPPAESTFVFEKNILIGNVALYGATSGQVFVRGLAGERFCVRNSGAHAVVEGVGDHGCEYMTGGRVVVLGPTGINFAAGMSGGVAYVFDEWGDFASVRCNLEMVELEKVEAAQDVAELKALVEAHWENTRSGPARRILDQWDALLPRFVKVMPTEYKRALRQMAELEAQLQQNMAAKH